MASLGCAQQLNGHEGCVNRCAWSDDGTMLASVSDDTKLILWRWGQNERVKTATGKADSSQLSMAQAASVSTAHRANIFGISFLPHSYDSVTCSMDGRVAWNANDGSAWESRLIHVAPERIKNVVVGHSPSVAYAAVEDGTVLQFDLRTVQALTEADMRDGRHRLPDSINKRNAKLLLAMRASVGAGRVQVIEAKSVHVSAANPYHMVVAASDQYIRLYDLRMLPPLDSTGVHDSMADAHRYVLRFTPLHFAPDFTGVLSSSGEINIGPPRLRSRHQPADMHSTYAEFDSSGRNIVATYHGDCVYVFDALGADGSGPLQALGSQPVDWWDVVDTSSPPGVESPPPPQRATALLMEQFPQQCNRPPSPLACDSLPPAASEAKEAGNRAFASSSWSAAIRDYTGGITATLTHRARGRVGRVAFEDSPDPLATLHANRAMAYLKRGHPGDASDAVADCTRALELSPSYWKAELRLAKAVQATGHTSLALQLAMAFVSLHKPASYGAAELTTASLPPPDLALAIEDAESLVRSLRGGLTEEAVKIAAERAERAGADAGGRLSNIDEEDDERSSRTSDAASESSDDGTGDEPAAAATGTTPDAQADDLAASRRQRWVRRDRLPDGRHRARGVDDADDHGSDSDDEGEEEGGDAQDDVAPPGELPSDVPIAFGGEGASTITRSQPRAPPSAADHGSGFSNPALGYPAAGLLPAAPAMVSDPGAFAGPLWEADPQLLCTRHSVRCAGIRNVQTDIKEAAFWETGTALRPALDSALGRGNAGLPRDVSPLTGSRGGYIVAGSDCGNVLVFDRSTGTLIAALPDDEDVTNCVRPHPTLPVLASSGIMNTIRLWAPSAPFDPESDAEAGSARETAAVSGAAEEPPSQRTVRLPRRGALISSNDGRPRLVTTEPSQLDQLAAANTMRSRTASRGASVSVAQLRALAAQLAGAGRAAGGDGDEDDEGGEDFPGLGPGVRCVQQ